MQIDLTLAEFTSGMQKLIGESNNLDTTIKIVFEDGGVIFIDGKSLPHQVSNADRDAEVTLRMSLATLNKLYRRELHPATAAITGKIKLEGDLSQALKLEAVLRPYQA